MPLNAPPDPPPTDLIDEATRILEDRAAAVDKEEVAALRSWIGRRRREWEQWEYEEWLYRGIEEPGLMRRPGQYVNKKDAEVTWAIPNSMRNVDAECKAVITGLYRDAAAGADDDDPPDPSAAPLLPAGEGGGD
jgi:hypothetical protein